MRSIIYHSFEDNVSNGLNHNSRASSELPLVVNCAGKINLERKFETYNTVGRADYYLMYLVSGRLKVYLPDGVRMAEAGDFIIFPPEYKYRYYSSGSVALSYYFVHFTGSDVERIIERCALAPLPCLWHAGSSDEAVAGFSSLFEEYARADELRDVSLCSSLLRVLLALSKSVRAKNGERPLSRSMTYIISKYTEDISVPYLAEMEGLSVSRYNTLFREINGTSPIKYIISLRMNHACTLLATTNLAINEIGSAVGYQDNHFFSKLFKKYVGIAPQTYRSSSNAIEEQE